MTADNPPLADNVPSENEAFSCGLAPAIAGRSRGRRGMISEQ
jgi:hypothetical protein